MSAMMAPEADLFISEARDGGQSFAISEGASEDDGTRLIYVIRPGLGNKAHKHYYSPEMLAKNAHVFKGWPMYVDHLSESARKALGGLPRSIRDLGGRVIESWWDPSVPADDRHEAGAVVARVKPLGYMRHLVEDAPDLVRTSIAASATGVRPTTYRGGKAYAVEGIAANGGSVDWVTEAGAGGRIVDFITEAAQTDYVAEFFEDQDDREVRSWLKEYRPELAESLLGEDDPGGSDMPQGITNEALAEALATGEARSLIESLVREALSDDVQVNALIEARLDEEREIIVREAQARADRQIQLRDFRDHAHGLIEAARLPERLAEASRAKFDMTDGRATPALDVVDDIDADFKVVKAAAEKLQEAVVEEIKTQREIAASIRPTRVTGQGRVQEGKVSEGEGEQSKQPERVAELLRSSGFAEPEKVY